MSWSMLHAWCPKCWFRFSDQFIPNSPTNGPTYFQKIHIGRKHRKDRPACRGRLRWVVNGYDVIMKG